MSSASVPVCSTMSRLRRFSYPPRRSLPSSWVRSFSSTTGIVAPLSLVPPREPTSVELAGFVPRPPPVAEKPRKKGRTGKILGIYFIFHALPLGGAVWYFQQQKEERLRNSIACLPNDAGAIAQEATRTFSLNIPHHRREVSCC